MMKGPHFLIVLTLWIYAAEAQKPNPVWAVKVTRKAYYYDLADNSGTKKRKILGGQSEFRFNNKGQLLEAIQYKGSSFKYPEQIFKYEYNNNKGLEVRSGQWLIDSLHKLKEMFYTTFEYNEKGALIKRRFLSSETDSLIRETYFQYDSLGRLELVRFDKTIDSLMYDSTGRLCFRKYEAYDPYSFVEYYTYTDSSTKERSYRPVQLTSAFTGLDTLQVISDEWIAYSKNGKIVQLNGGFLPTKTNTQEKNVFEYNSKGFLSSLKYYFLEDDSTDSEIGGYLLYQTEVTEPVDVSAIESINSYLFWHGNRHFNETNKEVINNFDAEDEE